MRVLTLLIPFAWVGVAKAQLPDFRDLVKDVSPSVANISTTNAMPETVSDPRLDQMPDIFRESSVILQALLVVGQASSEPRSLGRSSSSVMTVLF